MRLKSIYISNYKNLTDFTVTFDGESFLDIFVGRNGTGKSNLFEALTQIFSHIYESRTRARRFYFAYRIAYEIEGSEIVIEWKEDSFFINGDDRKTIGSTSLPDNVLIYYSGHNVTISGMIERYRDSFRRRLREVDEDDSRRFIGVGTEYKELLLASILMQPSSNRAKAFLLSKLGIKKIDTTVNLVLGPPYYVDTNAPIDPIDPGNQFWGMTGVVRSFLEKLLICVKDGFAVGELYNRAANSYTIPIDIEQFQKVFGDESAADVFRQFDNLKTARMLRKITVPIVLQSGLEATIAHFSDGQFQSVYIYSLIEIFKDRNCITLLDEPDSFLHPEWQFDFLKQIFEITETDAANNHVLMSSHSAVTLIPHIEKKIKFFDIKNNSANCYPLDKRIAIKKLSSDLIKYSESEQLLSIVNAIQIEKKPVFFTEGSTDPIILKEAWYKLYDDDIPFIPFYAFSSTYINQLLTDDRIHAEMGGLPVFALFDFDKAFDQWNGLKGQVIVDNPILGMIKKWDNGESYAFMLPVPVAPKIRGQVINPANGQTFGGGSHCEIEHMFYGEAAAEAYFVEEPNAGGSLIKFKSDGQKTDFAKDVVPLMPVACFEPFRHMFEFVKTKIP